MPIQPKQISPVTLVRAQQIDLDDLAAIRIEAMRESLERVGRFDPVRARERFVSGFEAHNTHHIEVSGERVGFVVVKHHPNELVLDANLLYDLQGNEISSVATLASLMPSDDVQADQASFIAPSRHSNSTVPPLAPQKD